MPLSVPGRPVWLPCDSGSGHVASLNPGAALLRKQQFGTSRELWDPLQVLEVSSQCRSTDREGAGVAEVTHTSPLQVPFFQQESSFRRDLTFCQTVT